MRDRSITVNKLERKYEKCIGHVPAFYEKYTEKCVSKHENTIVLLV